MLKPIVFKSSATESNHLRAGLPGLFRVKFLQGLCPHIQKIQPSHLDCRTLITARFLEQSYSLSLWNADFLLNQCRIMMDDDELVAVGGMIGRGN
jgi:hypothetical protein